MADKPSAKREPGKYPVIYRNLMSVGLLGVIYRVGEDAQTINAAVESTLAEPGAFSTYCAVALAMAGQTEYARNVLGGRVEEQPQDDQAKVALAVSLLFGGDPGWRHWVDNVLATSTDQPTRQAALGVLSYVGEQRYAH
jgi:hypothetical protein